MVYLILGYPYWLPAPYFVSQKGLHSEEQDLEANLERNSHEYLIR
jgi:hypothetical protein